MMRFDFPGNVRQLENICHWLTVMAPAQTIEPKDLPPELLSLGAAAALPVALSGSPATASAVFSSSVPAASMPEPVSAGAVVPDAMAKSFAAEVPREPLSSAEVPDGPSRWLVDLERESRSLLLAGEPDVWDTLTRKFEAQLIHTALDMTRGRRIEAAQKLGIGRNTITRKIQELGLDD